MNPGPCKQCLKDQKKAFSTVGAMVNDFPVSWRELPKNEFKTKLHSFLTVTVLSKQADYIDISQLRNALKITQLEIDLRSTVQFVNIMPMQLCFPFPFLFLNESNTQ